MTATRRAAAPAPDYRDPRDSAKEFGVLLRVPLTH